MSPTTHVIEVWGDFACFSRPELKVERWSYPCPTPAAARGIFDAIYVKPPAPHKPPAFRWQVRRIEVLSVPAYIALRRNEVKDVANVAAIEKWMTGAAEPEPIWADGDRETLGTDEKGRTQRQTMALKNVRYRLYAEVRPWPGFEGESTAFDEQFRRRAEHGKCFQQPCFGAREFPAFFKLLNGERHKEPVPLDQDLGFMLYDVFDLSRPGGAYDAPFISLFRAKLKKGVLEVPPFESTDVLKPEGEAA